MKLMLLLNKLPRPVIMFLALSLCVIVGLVDRINGPDYSLVPFYLVSIVLAAWFAGRSYGYLLSFVSYLSWLIAEIAGGQNYNSIFALLWNNGMRIGLFFLTTTLVSALKGALDRENIISRTDQLSGLPNRRSYFELVEGEMKRNHRYEEPFSIAYLDIDNFKGVNDAGGHTEGDKLIQRVAATLSSAVRETDTVARLGGDEFAILLPETDADSALTVATKMREQLKMNVENVWPVTFSVGLVTYLESPDSIDEVIGRADQLMYEAKGASKNALRLEVVRELKQEVKKRPGAHGR